CKKTGELAHVGDRPKIARQSHDFIAPRGRPAPDGLVAEPGDMILARERPRGAAHGVEIGACPAAPFHVGAEQGNAEIIKKNAEDIFDVAGDGPPLKLRVKIGKDQGRPPQLLRSFRPAIAHGLRSMILLTLKLCAPAAGKYIDLPPPPPATTTIRSR